MPSKERIKLSQIHVGAVLDVVNGIEIIDCTDSKFTHALMTEDSPDVYSSYYYESERLNYISSNKSESEWWDLTYGERISKIDSLTGYPTRNLRFLGFTGFVASNLSGNFSKTIREFKRLISV